MNEGFIKLHRKVLNWEWWEDHNVFRLFVYLLILCNHKDKKWRGQIIKRGQVIVGRVKLAEGTGLSEQQIRTALDKLKSTSNITTKTTNRFTLITVCNYSLYHDYKNEDNQQITSHVTNKQPTDNQQITTTKKILSKDSINKNGKNDKKEKEKEFIEVTGIDMDLVKITQKEYQKILDKFGNEGAAERISTLNGYGHQFPKKFKEYGSHYHTILAWARKEGSDKAIPKTPEQEEKEFLADAERRKRSGI
jgi:hypothetical protein